MTHIKLTCPYEFYAHCCFQSLYITLYVTRLLVPLNFMLQFTNEHIIFVPSLKVAVWFESRKPEDKEINQTFAIVLKFDDLHNFEINGFICSNKCLLYFWKTNVVRYRSKSWVASGHINISSFAITNLLPLC